MRTLFRKNTVIILAATAAGIFVAVAAGSYLAPPPSPGANATGNSESAAELASTGGTYAYPFVETSEPIRLVIPSINVNAPVQPVGIGKSGDMAVTDSFWTVGWYKSGPAPGAPGSAVIEGHLDQVVSPYAVFFNLDELKPGDEVDVVDAENRTVRFTVVGSTVEPYNAPTDDLFGMDAEITSSSESLLNLVTCAGTWIQAQHQYNERLVVFTKRI